MQQLPIQKYILLFLLIGFSSSALNQVITGTASGDLTKEGSETLAFEVAPTFDGDIIVNDGKVLFNCDASGMSGSVTVNSGGTVGGSGTLPASTVATGGIVAPGQSIGTITYASLVMSGTYEWEVGNDPNADLIDVTGNLDITGGVTVEVSKINGTSQSGTQTNVLFTYGSISGDTNDITMVYTGISGSDPVTIGNSIVVIGAIPEPGIIGLLSILALAIIRRK